MTAVSGLQLHRGIQTKINVLSTGRDKVGLCICCIDAVDVAAYHDPAC